MTEWEKARVWLAMMRRQDTVSLYCRAHQHAPLTHPTFGRLESVWPGIFDIYAAATEPDWQPARLWTPMMGGSRTC